MLADCGHKFLAMNLHFCAFLIPGWALCGHETAQGSQEETEDGSGGADCSPAVSTASSPPTELEDGSAWDPHRLLPRAERIAIGLGSKALIDAARLDYLKAAGMTAELVAYVAPDVSGENKLLLARASDAS